MILGDVPVGIDHAPFVLAELGINHSGSVGLAIEMIRLAHRSGASCVKLQTHTDDEFSDTPAYPANANGESIQSLIRRCSLTENEERTLKAYAEGLGLVYLSTPFSMGAVDRLERMGVIGYKIGSGQLTDLKLVERIARIGKPVILSTGMGTIADITSATNILEAYGCEYALMACTSLYPTPYADVRLGTVQQLRDLYPRASAVGLSCHSVGIWTALGAVSLGASVLEKHFAIDGSSGPDLEVSIGPNGMRDLVTGARAIWEARGGTKTMLEAERSTKDWVRKSRRHA